MDTKLARAFIRALKVSIEAEGLREIARRSGLSPTTLSGWLNEGKCPSLDAASKVSAQIGFNLGPHNA
jgi:DNA-binding phage protein